MNMGALFNVARKEISPDDDVTSGDIGFCWACSLRNAYYQTTQATWEARRKAGLAWFGEISESL